MNKIFAGITVSAHFFYRLFALRAARFADFFYNIPKAKNEAKDLLNGYFLS